MNTTRISLAYSLPTQTLGSFIKSKRQEKKLSIRQLAEAVKEEKKTDTPFSPGFLSEIENGRRFPSDILFSILAKVLGVDETTLRSFDQRMPSDELKELQQINPQFGFAFRRAVEIIREDNLTPNELLERLHNSNANNV